MRKIKLKLNELENNLLNFLSQSEFEGCDILDSQAELEDYQAELEILLDEYETNVYDLEAYEDTANECSDAIDALNEQICFIEYALSKINDMIDTTREIENYTYISSNELDDDEKENMTQIFLNVSNTHIEFYYSE